MVATEFCPASSAPTESAASLIESCIALGWTEAQISSLFTELTGPELPKSPQALYLYHHGHESLAHDHDSCGRKSKMATDGPHSWRSFVFTCHQRFEPYCSGKMDRAMFERHDGKFHLTTRLASDHLRSLFYVEISRPATIEHDALRSSMDDLNALLHATTSTNDGVICKVVPRQGNRLVAKVICWGDTDCRRTLARHASLGRVVPITNHTDYQTYLHRLCDSELPNDAELRARQEIEFKDIRLSYTLGAFYNPEPEPSQQSPDPEHLFPSATNQQGNNLHNRRRFCPDCSRPAIAESEWLPINATLEQIRNAKWYRVVPPPG